KGLEHGLGVMEGAGVRIDGRGWEGESRGATAAGAVNRGVRASCVRAALLAGRQARHQGMEAEVAHPGHVLSTRYRKTLRTIVIAESSTEVDRWRARIGIGKGRAAIDS